MLTVRRAAPPPAEIQAVRLCNLPNKVDMAANPNLVSSCPTTERFFRSSFILFTVTSHDGVHVQMGGNVSADESQQMTMEDFA